MVSNKCTVFTNYRAVNISSSRSSYWHVERHAQPEATNVLPSVYNWAMTRSSSPISATILRPSHIMRLADDQMCIPCKAGPFIVSGITRSEATVPFIYATVFTCRHRREWTLHAKQTLQIKFSDKSLSIFYRSRAGKTSTLLDNFFPKKLMQWEEWVASTWSRALSCPTARTRTSPRWH
jgi:hypothetical protein